MVKIFVYCILAVGFYAFNLGFMQKFLFYGAVPNLLLFLIIFIAIEEKGDFYIPLSFLWGLALDFACGLSPGSFAFSFLFVAVMLRQISQNTVSFERNWKFLPFAFLFSEMFILFWMFILNLLGSKFGQSKVAFAPAFFGQRFFWESIYGLIIFYPMWKIFKHMQVQTSKFSNRIK